jgi:hypothetical protein
MRLNVFPGALHLWKGRFFKNICSFDDRSTAPASTNSHWYQVIVNAMNIPNPRNNKKAIVGALHYLAAFYGGGITARFEHQSIRSDNDPAPRASSQDKSGMGTVRCSEDQ